MSNFLLTYIAIVVIIIHIIITNKVVLLVGSDY